MKINGIGQNRLQNHQLTSQQTNCSISFSGSNILANDVVKIGHNRFSSRLAKFGAMIMTPLALLTGHAHAQSFAAAGSHGTIAIAGSIGRVHHPGPLLRRHPVPVFIHPGPVFIPRPVIVESYPVLIEQPQIITRVIQQPQVLVQQPQVLVEQPQIIERVVEQNYSPATEQVPVIIKEEPKKIIEVHTKSSSVYDNNDTDFQPFDSVIRYEEVQAPVYQWIKVSTNPPAQKLIGFKTVRVPVTN